MPAFQSYFVAVTLQAAAASDQPQVQRLPDTPCVGGHLQDCVVVCHCPATV